MASSKCDFESESGTLAIRGGESRAAKRTLYLTPEVVAILSARLTTAGACREAGVSFVLYDLRHTFGTRQGTELKTALSLWPRSWATRTCERSCATSIRISQQKQAMERYAVAMRRRKMRRVK